MKIKLLILTALTLAAKLSYSQTARVEVKLINSPFLIVEHYSFFKKGNDIKIEKDNDGSFIINYYGNEPKLYNINFRDILISPGDDVSLIYQKLSLDINSSKDTLLIGINKADNYKFSNEVSILMPKIDYPNFEGSEFRGNLNLAFTNLKQKHILHKNNMTNKLEKLHCNNELKQYLLRRIDQQLYYYVDGMAEKIGVSTITNPKLILLKDSIFNSITFKESDTSYAYYSEKLFENHFKLLVNSKFNQIKTEKDFNQLIKYLEQFENTFIRNYFIYFLATDYKYLTNRYNYQSLQNLVSKNPYLTKIRNQVLNQNNIYK